MSEKNEKNIYQRMAEVMKAVAYVQKEDKKVNNQYTFVSHDAVTAKLRPALIEAGIFPVVTVKNRSQDGNRTDVTILVRFVNVDKPEEHIEVESFGYGIDPSDKGPGKAVSYAFKYALLKTFCLETGDDPERDNIEHKPAVKPGVPENEVADLQIALREAESMQDLDRISAPLAKLPLSDEQRLTLSVTYSKRKRELKTAA
ncbi:ERF family protein [Paraburkholderia atlantica]|uniref:ERF family protein n=1 Tax=Paraburkholderia atlantica TaxID=2654982 RepID=UPI0016139A32|nr:ERF family protein [Paraburkholderia atlantica]MBB5509601.1 hypothetical protein [Paraburkholderia atlantica]